jgi:hypothetical protein
MVTTPSEVKVLKHALIRQCGARNVLCFSLVMLQVCSPDSDGRIHQYAIHMKLSEAG